MESVRSMNFKYSHTCTRTVLFAIDPKYIKFKLPEYTHAFFLLTYKDCILTIKAGKNITLSFGKLWVSAEGKELWGLLWDIRKRLSSMLNAAFIKFVGHLKQSNYWVSELLKERIFICLFFGIDIIISQFFIIESTCTVLLWSLHAWYIFTRKHLLYKTDKGAKQKMCFFIITMTTKMARVFWQNIFLCILCNMYYVSTLH